MVGYGYFIEAFMAWYSNNRYEKFAQLNRMLGPYAVAYWSLLLCNVLVPQALWFKRVRSHPAALFLVSVVVLIGMWLERYVIVITSLHRDFLPSSWGMYQPTGWDWATFIGSIGLFLSLLFLFLRFLPMISISEMRALLPQSRVQEPAGAPTPGGSDGH
jgi:molybdopterin-containing oxidoreductase family membrane subunit